MEINTDIHQHRKKSFLELITFPKIIRNKSYLSLIGVFLVLNLIYLHLNDAMQIWDSSAHINLSLQYSQKITSLDFASIPTLSWYYPPFIHLLTSIFYIIFPSLSTPLVVSFLFYILFIISFYFMVLKIVYNHKTVALLSVAIVSFFPQIFREIRIFELDLPLTTLLCSSFLFLHCSKGLTNRRFSILFFALLTLSTLTKWYAFIFAVVPFLFEIYKYRLAVNKHKFIILKNILLGLIIILIFAGPWYLANFHSLVNFYFDYSSKGELNDPTNIFSLASITEYYQLISVFQTYYFNFLIAIASLVYLIYKKSTVGIYLFFAIAFPYLVFSLLVNKDARYLMPLSIYFAMLIAIFLLLIQKYHSKLGKIVTISYLSLSLSLFLLISFNQLKALPNYLKPINILLSGHVSKYYWFNQPTEMSFKEDYKMYETLSQVNNFASTNNTKPVILFDVDYPYYNKVQFDTLTLLDRSYLPADVVSEDLEIKNLSTYNFIVTSHNPGLQNLRHYQKMVDINRYLWSSQNTIFEHFTKITLPNNEDIFIFAKRKT